MKLLQSLLIICLSLTSLRAQNLINNGSFEYGGSGVGFVIDGAGYNLLSPPYTGSSSAGNYAFVTNPQTINSQFFVSSGDHTTGTGKMLVIDGNSTGGQQRFWKAGNNGGGICNLTVGQTYTFSYWIRTVTNGVSGASELANIGVQFNNASNVFLSYGTAFAPLPNTGWVQVRYTFTPTNACVNIEMFNNNTGFTGNDFAIDDVALTAPTTPLSFTYSVTQPNCSDPNSGLIVIYPTGGVAPYLFQVKNGPMPIPTTNVTGVFQYLEPGTYTIGLQDNTGAIDSVENVVINTISPITISPGDTTVCPNSNLTFTAGGGGNSAYNWTASPNDPELSVIDQPTINISPNNTTTYTVSTNVNSPNLVYNGNFELGNNGFMSEYKNYAPNNPNGAQRAYGIVTNASNWYNTFGNCVDHTSGDGNGRFMVIDGSTYNLGNEKFWCQQIAVEPNKDYLFSYWVQTVSLNNVAKIETRVNGNVIGTQNALNQNCVWNQVSYVWNSGNNLIAEFCLIDKEYQAIGNDFSIDDISLRSQNSCGASVTVTMKSVDPNFDLSYPTNICLNESPVSPTLGPDFITGGIYNVVQQGLNINNLTGQINPSGTAPGTYEVTYSAPICGQYYTDTNIVVIRPLPGLLELTGGDYYCEGQQFNPLTLYVEGTPNYTIYYNIDGNPQVVENATTVPISIGNAFGVYDLDSITDAFCSNIMVGAQTISINDVPQLPIVVGDTVYCKNSVVNELTIQNGDGKEISWYSDSALTQLLGTTQTFLPSNQNTQTYYVSETLNGCKGPATTVTVTIENCPLIIPTAFTPNDDGDNDFWQLIGLDDQFPENTVSVFNRWGETIYESIPGNYSSKPWDGKYKGALLPVSSYYFVIQRSKDGSIETLNGTVSIILKK
jgi:gliding motility-associated-like protein